MDKNKPGKNVITIKPDPSTVKSLYAWELTQEDIDDMARMEIPEEAWAFDHEYDQMKKP